MEQKKRSKFAGIVDSFVADPLSSLPSLPQKKTYKSIVKEATPDLPRVDMLWMRGHAGPPGNDGKDGRDGVDGKDGKDGIDGKDGKDGRDGEDGKDGRDGVDGKDGASVMGPQGPPGPVGPAPPIEKIITLVGEVVARGLAKHEDFFRHDFLHDPRTLGRTYFDDATLKKDLYLKFDGEKFVCAPAPVQQIVHASHHPAPMPDSTSAQLTPTEEITADYTVRHSDFLLLCDATSGDINLTLYDANKHPKRRLIIQKIDSSSNSVNILPQSGQLIGGMVSSGLIVQWSTLTISSFAGNWYILSA